MTCARSASAAIGSLLLLIAGTVHGADAKPPCTDLYGDPLPPGAIARLGTIRLRHADAEVTFSKDSKQMISFGTDGEVRFWDVATGRRLQRRRLIIPFGKEIDEIALSANGALAATRSWKTVCLYDTKTGNEIGRQSIETSVELITFSPDGQLLALKIVNGQNEWSLQVWSTNPFKRRSTCGEVNPSSIVFTLDGKRVAGIGSIRKLRVWDTTTGAMLIESKECTHPLERELAFSPDGKVLAIGSDHDCRVRLLDAATLKTKAVLKPPANLQANIIDYLVFAPDGRHVAGAYSEDSIAASTERGVLIWDVTASEPVRRIPQRYTSRMVFAPDGKKLACNQRAQGEIGLWDVDSCRPLLHAREPGGCVEVLRVSPDGKTLASRGRTARLCLWDVATGKLRHVLDQRDKWNGTGFCLFSPDGKQVIAANFGTFHIWDVATGKELQSWQIDPHSPFQVGVHTIGVSADGKRVAAVAYSDDSRSTHILVWDAASGKRLILRSSNREIRFRSNLNQSKPWLSNPSDLEFALDGESATMWLGKRVGVEEVSTGALLASLPEDVGGPIVFSPDGRLMAAAVLERKFRLNQAEHVRVEGISLIETATGAEVLRLDNADFEYAAFTPDGRGLVVVDTRKLRVWDTLTGERLHEMTWPREVKYVRGEVKVCSLAVLPDRRAATGMMDGDILLWDLEPAKWPSLNAIPDLHDTKCDALWSDLAGRADKAHRAIAALAASPTKAVAFLKDRLQPVALDAKRIDKLLADLDSDSFEKRDSASRELIRLRYRADAILERARNAKPSLEMRHRLEAILAEPKRPPAEALRTLRAIAVLERIGTPEARRILKKLASGAASPETCATQAALQRLKQRDAWAKERATP